MQLEEFADSLRLNRYNWVRAVIIEANLALGDALSYLENLVREHLPGTVILSGVLAATLFTLFVVPVAYDLLARYTGSPGDVARRLELETGNR